jgi:parallel beta-helix repeat protein
MNYLARKILPWILLMGLLPSAALALVLDRDTVWRGTVLIEEEVLVAPEATLLIEPGARVRFVPTDVATGSAPIRLTVLGKLIAQGTAGAPILFTSAAEKPVPGDWAGLVFENNVETTVSRLRHCRIEYADTAIGGTLAALVVEDTRVQHNKLALLAQKKFSGGMFNCELLDNDNGAQFVQNSRFRLENCRILRSLGDGVFCNKNSSPSIAHCEIAGGAAGVRCLLGASPSIEGCLIRDNRVGVHVEMKSHPQLHGNDILTNDTGVHAEKLVAPLLVGNRIAENEVGIYCNYSGYPLIRENRIENNREFAIVLGDNQSREVDRLLPEAKNRKLQQRGEDLPVDAQVLAEERVVTAEDFEILFDARDNWWGEAATAHMKRLGGPGDVAIFEDFFDKPEVEYQGRRYPRDAVVYTPWAEVPPAPVGRAVKNYAGIVGKVVRDGKPVEGARVHVFREPSANLRGEGFSFSAPTDGDGRFSLNLAPGRYYLTAKKTASPFPAAEPMTGDLFSYFGGNPVSVAEGAEVAVNLQAARVSAVGSEPFAEAETALLTGRIDGPGGPVAGVRIYLYPDAANGFRGPDLFGPQGAVPGGTDEQGRFVVEVPPGDYYLVATRRADGQLGPLRVGDLFGFAAGNPLHLEGGKKTVVALDLVEKLRSPRDAAPEVGQPADLRGVIRDEGGAPLAGVYAFAFTEPYPVGTIPPFRSRPTAADGAFVLPLAGPGTYYVGARSGHGGPPLPGEWHSFHGDAQMRKIEMGEDGAPVPIDIGARRME